MPMKWMLGRGAGGDGIAKCVQGPDLGKWNPADWHD